MDIPSLSPQAMALVSAIVFGAATVKGLAGLGFPLIAVPLVANVVGPHSAVVIIVVPTVASNLFMVAQGWGPGGHLRQMGWLILGLVAGAAVGARMLREINPAVLAAVLGVVAVGYSTAELARLPLRLSSAPRPPLSLGVGAAAGLLGGATSIYAPLLAAYVDSLRLGKDEFVFWVTVLFLIGTSTQVLTYLQVGIYRSGLLGPALWLCLPMLAGTWLGIRLRGRLSPGRFRTLVLVLVLLSGTNLIARFFWR